MTSKKIEKKAWATVASPGIGLGYLYLLENMDHFSFVKKIATEEVSQEILNFNDALQESRKQLDHVKEKIVKEYGEDHSYLVEAQLLMLSDVNVIR